MKKAVLVTSFAMILLCAGAFSVRANASALSCMESARGVRASTIIAAMKDQSAAVAAAKAVRQQVVVATKSLKTLPEKIRARVAARRAYRSSVNASLQDLESAKLAARSAYAASVQSCNPKP